MMKDGLIFIGGAVVALGVAYVAAAIYLVKNNPFG